VIRIKMTSVETLPDISDWMFQAHSRPHRIRMPFFKELSICRMDQVRISRLLLRAPKVFRELIHLFRRKALKARNLSPAALTAMCSLRCRKTWRDQEKAKVRYQFMIQE
jgi:hypothetical protein